MSKFTCLVLCAFVVSLSSVFAGADFREAMKPIAMDCMKEFGVSEDDVKKAKETRNLEGVDPCFVGCILKKFGIINDKGEYDVDSNIDKMKMLVKNEDNFAKLSQIAKDCGSVNDQAVGDGKDGCERAVLVTKCFMDHKSEIPM